MALRIADAGGSRPGSSKRRKKAKPTVNRPAASQERTRPATVNRPAASQERSQNENLERSVNRAVVRVKAGKSPVKVDSGDIRTPAMRKLAAANRKKANEKAVANMGVLSFADMKKVGSDLVNLPKTVVQGTYEMAAAAAEAATGDTKRAKKLAKGFTEHDPFYLAATGQTDKARKELEAHPGLASLELWGGSAAVGRGATRVQRKVTGKDPTKREAAKYPDSNLAVPRKYTENAIARPAQKLRERQQIRNADEKRAEARHLEKTDPAGSVGKAERLRREANRQDPRVMSDRQARVRGARSAATGRVVTQRNQVATAKAGRNAITPTKARKLRRRAASEKPSAVHSLVAQGIIDNPAQLAAYRSRVEARLNDPEVADFEKASMRKTLADIDAAVKSKPDAAQVESAAKGYKAIGDSLQRDLEARGVLPKGKGEKAPLVPYAIANMPGVVPGPKGPMRKATEADHKATPVSAARAAQRDADKALTKAVAAHSQAVGRAQILTRNVTGVEKPRTGYAGGSRAVNETKAALDKAKLTATAARKDRVLAERAWKSEAGKRKQASAGKKGYVRVTAAEIKTHMGAERGGRVAFVSQRPAGSAGGPKGGTLSVPTTGSAVRTGRSTDLGSADFTPQAMIDTLRNSQRLKDLADNYSTTIREAGSPNHTNLSRSQANKRAKELAERNGVEYRVVPVDPFAENATLARTLDDADGPDSELAAEAIREAVVDAYSGKAESKSGKYTLVPRSFAQELIDQANSQRPTGAIGTTMRGANSLFRRTVLATSPTWITGNALEGALRSAIGGVRPGDKKLFNQIVTELDKTDPRLAQELRARVAGGGHYQSVDMAQRGSVLDGYHGTSVDGASRALQAFWHKPGPKQAADLWNHYTHFVFNQLSGRMESSIQSSMAGAAIRRSNLVPQKTFARALRLNDTAVQQAAKGLTNTNEQAALGEMVARMYGRYDGFTADGRFYIANFTPFAAWALNAANFVLRVLPQDHPTFVTLQVIQERANRDIRKEHKLDDLPDWLAGSIPLSGGRKLRLNRYTPFGLFSEPGANAVNLVLPQFSGVRNALAYGMDWKGQKVYKDGKPIDSGDRALLALQSFSEATIPLIGKIKQTVTKGPSSLNPFKPVAPPPAKGSKRTPKSDSAGGSGIDFSTFSGGGASGIDFEGFEAIE